MKNTSSILTQVLLAGALALGSGAAMAAAATTFGSRLPAKIHVIQNYEDWNDVLIRFSGVFRNGCYSKGTTTARVEGDQVLIDNLVFFSAAELIIVPLVGMKPVFRYAPSGIVCSQPVTGRFK